ncbi:MAG: SDR family NAD(P)-dependent oxidoreductase [Alphaproteobacteria bacterium]
MANPVCVIAGVGPGIGLAVARKFGAAGFSVALLGRRQEKLTAYTTELAEEGIDTQEFVADLSDSESIREAFDHIEAWNSRIEVLIYNAADMTSDDATSLTAAAMMRSLQLTLGGAMTSIGCVLPGMLARRTGTILATSGGLAFDPYPQWTALGAGKAALHNYIGALHKAVSPKGVKAGVVAVCGIVGPGGPFDPDRIAEKYWAMHRTGLSDWQYEEAYRPAEADPDYNARS